mmetsp:Transcript_8295/g.24948  ORF Transcript_8295/g.24948 Transcript_8295/m.24948 type:complete len:290 (+) Transcript_8295:571-1440(+)
MRPTPPRGVRSRIESGEGRIFALRGGVRPGGTVEGGVGSDERDDDEGREEGVGDAPGVRVELCAEGVRRGGTVEGGGTVAEGDGTGGESEGGTRPTTAGLLSEYRHVQHRPGGVSARREVGGGSGPIAGNGGRRRWRWRWPWRWERTEERRQRQRGREEGQSRIPHPPESSAGRAELHHRHLRPRNGREMEGGPLVASRDDRRRRRRRRRRRFQGPTGRGVLQRRTVGVRPFLGVGRGPLPVRVHDKGDGHPHRRRRRTTRGASRGRVFEEGPLDRRRLLDEIEIEIEI